MRVDSIRTCMRASLQDDNRQILISVEVRHFIKSGGKEL